METLLVKIFATALALSQVTTAPDAVKRQQMTLGNMRRLGMHHLVATCLNDACGHQGVIGVSTFPTMLKCRALQ